MVVEGMIPFCGSFSIALILIVLVGLYRFGRPRVCVCIISEHAYRRAIEWEIDQRDLNFLCDLAEVKGFGLHHSMTVNKHGTNIMAKFDSSQSSALDQDTGLPVVILETVYRNKTKFNEDGSIKGPGDTRTWRSH